MKSLCVMAAALALVGCATELTSGGAGVHIVTAEAKPSCQSLGVVSTDQRTGPNKPGNAMNKALNAAAQRGANGLYIVSSSIDWAEGASVIGEALICPASVAR